MRVAVAYQDGEIYGHFGHCPMFAVYEYGEYVSDCTKKLVDSSDRSGHQQMADLMKELNVDAVIAGNMGGEGKAALLSYGIVPIVGYSGDADTASDLLVTGQLPTSPADGGCGGCSGNCGCAGHEEGCGCGGAEGGCSCGCWQRSRQKSQKSSLLYYRTARRFRNQEETSCWKN